MSSNNKQNGGIGFAGALAITFIVLKLTNVISWSWWWVLAPLWAPIAIALAIVAIAYVFGFIIKHIG